MICGRPGAPWRGGRPSYTLLLRSAETQLRRDCTGAAHLQHVGVRPQHRDPPRAGQGRVDLVSPRCALQNTHLC